VFRYTAPALSNQRRDGSTVEATKELGDKLLGLTVDALVDRIERGRVEEPPLGVAPAATIPPPSTNG